MTSTDSDDVKAAIPRPTGEFQLCHEKSLTACKAARCSRCFWSNDICISPPLNI